MLRRFALIASLVALAGCDSNDPVVPDFPGRSGVEVTGSPAFRFEGGATFYVTPQPDFTGYIINLNAAGLPGRGVGMSLVSEGALTPGVYPIGYGEITDSTFGRGATLITLYDRSPFFATEGTLTLTRVGAAVLEGTIEARLAPGLFPDSTAPAPTASITGSFEAVLQDLPPG